MRFDDTSLCLDSGYKILAGIPQKRGCVLLSESYQDSLDINCLNIGSSNLVKGAPTMLTHQKLIVSAQEPVYEHQELLSYETFSLPSLGCFDLTSRECILCVLSGIKTSPGRSLAAALPFPAESCVGAWVAVGFSQPLPGQPPRCSACLWCPREWRLTSFVGGKEKDLQDGQGPHFHGKKSILNLTFGS